MKRLLSVFGLLGVFILSAQSQLLIDFNSTTQDGGPHPEPGYQSYDAGHEAAPDFVTRTYTVDFAFSGTTDITLSPAWPNTTDSRVRQMIDRGGGNDANWLGNNLDLITDWLGTDTRTGNGGNGDYDGTTGIPTYLTLTLGGLPAGTYEWLSLHHDTEHMHTPFVVEISNDGGASFGLVGEFQMTDSTPGGNPDSLNTFDGVADPDPRNLPSTVRFLVVANGSDDVVLRFTPLSQVEVHQRFFGINGFELTEQAPAAQPKILLVSDNAFAGTRAGAGDPEAEMEAFLTGLGYEVIRATGSGGSAQFREANEGSAAAAASDADLILVSRVTNSGTYDEGNSGADWNAIEKPLLLLSPYLSRDSRWQWLNGGNSIDQSPITDLTFVDPNHPFVNGLGTDIFDTATTFSRNDLTESGNGTLIATTDDGDVALVEWQADVPFYDGGQTPAGPRVLMGGLRYHEDDGARQIVFEDYSENGKAILAQIINNLLPLPSSGYGEPEGGWAYKFDGDTAEAGSGAFTALDGTWSHENSSDEWDGSAIGAGAPGGVTQLQDGDLDYIRIQETGDPRDYGFPDPGSNRKIYLGHSVDADGFPGPILQDGFTLSFRAKIATGAPLDDQHPDGGAGTAPWPEEGIGYFGHDGGKGNVSIRQGDSGVISFSLDLDNMAGISGLNMNGLNGTSASNEVDPLQGEGTANIFPVNNLNSDWHEFWITIQADSSGGGTHKVNVYADGSETPATFDVTAGAGSDFDGNYIAVGTGATPQIGAWDLDFIAYKPGIFEPQRTGGGQAIRFDQQPFSITANEGDTVTFEAEVTGTPPRTLQWQRNGVNIEEANRDALTLDFVTRGDDGAVFTLVASNPFGTVVSDPATLTVISDNTPPTLLSASSADGVFVGVSTDDLLDPLPTEDPFNWGVDTATSSYFVEDATIQPNGRDVLLKVLGGPLDNPDFTVTAFGLLDAFGNESLAGIDEISGTQWLENAVDINVPDPAGVNFTSVEGEIEVTAGGADIWGTADQFTYVYETRENNFDVQVRVDSLDRTDANAKAGIMIRESLDPGSPIYWHNVTPPDGANTVQNGVRLTAAANVTDIGQPRPNVNEFPLWLRVRRVGTTFTSYISRDGSNWEINRADFDFPELPAQLFVGLGTTSHNQGTGATAKYAEYGQVDLYPDAVITLTGPDNQTVEDFHAATFTIDASVTDAPPEELLYQWERETSVGSGVFEPVPLATQASFTTGILTLFEDNGRAYRVVVSAGGSNPVTSAPATVTIVDDTTAPALLSAKGDATFTVIRVEFDELVDIFSATDPFSYTVSDGVNGINVLSATSATSDAGFPDATRAVTLVTEPMSPDTVYTVTAIGVIDLSFANESNSSASFRSFIISAGFALRQFYFDIPGVTIPELLAAPKYPAMADQVDYNSLLEGPVNAFDNYGLRISGWLIPETTGAYDFYMSSDDAGQFSLNLIADDNDPANLTPVASEPVSNGSRNWIGTDRRDPAAPENRSLTLFPDGINLEAGRMYAFEALMKEGTGGDNLGVTAVPHGSEPPRIGSSPISGAFKMASAADPEGASVTITSQPQNVIIGVGCETDDSDPGSDTAFLPPSGGWTYLYGGDDLQGLGTCKPDIALDGTWNANNGSSEWDGSLRGAGNGAPGGVSTDNGVLTIEDINQGSGSCNNRKIYFTHDLNGDLDPALADNILDSGVTMTFRARLTQPDVMPPAEVPTPDGWGIFSNGKGHFVVRQSNPGAAVAFSLVRESEPDNNYNFPSAGLTMNRLNGDSPTGGGVNSSSSAGDNQVLALDPNAFHEFWITIQANDETPGNGTHTVSIYVDGSPVPQTFDVTAGTGSDGPFSNFLAMGLNNSGGNGVVDIDFFGFKEGVHVPSGGGSGGAGLLVDFNSTSQDGGPHPEAGYQSYDAAHEVSADFVTRTYAANFAVTGPASVSLTPSWPNTTDNRVQQMIDRGAGNDANWLGNNLDLLTDFLGIDTRTGNGGNGDYDGATGTPTHMDLTLGDLPPGTYNWLSYHHDTENVHPPFIVSVSTDGGGSFSEVGRLQMTDSSPGGNPDSGILYMGDADPDPRNLPSTARFNFVATGADVVVRFTPLSRVAVHQQIFGINGFELNQAIPAGSPALLVDFNSTSQDSGPHPEPGYESYDAAHEVPADFITRTYEANFTFTGPAMVSVTPTWPNTTDARVRQMIDRTAGFDANWVGSNLDLLTDFLGIDTRTGNGGNGNYDGTTGTPTHMDLTLGGLAPGNYNWLSYHHDTEHVHAPFIVSLSTDGGGSFTEIGRFQMTDSTTGGNPDSGMVFTGAADPDPRNLPSTVGFSIPATGDDVVVRFTPLSQAAVHQQIWGINGFELTQATPASETFVSFSIEADGQILGNDEPPLLIQWLKNGANIPGANDPTLNVGISEDDAGAEFRAVVYVPGASVMSDPATVITAQTPQVAITDPADGSILAADAPATLVAQAVNGDGNVVQVEFFNEGASLGVDSDGSNGWTLDIPSVPAGLYVLTAIATDDLGLSCGSEPVMVEAVDNRPPACEPVAATTAEDTPVTFALLASDPDGDALTYSIVSGAAGGSVLIEGSMATYSPNPNYNGPDSFTFKVADPFGLESDECLVSIEVLPVNDAPVCSDASAVTDEDVPVSVNLSASDVDGDPLTYTVLTGPANGSVALENGSATYTPAANNCGADSFTFKVTDPAGAESGVCTVSITINAVNDAPSPVIAVAPLSDLGPTVPGLIVISPNNEDVCVVLDGSASSDVDAGTDCGNGTIVSYTWLVDELEVGTGAVLDACLLVGAREVKLLVEDGDGAIGEATAIVEVLSGCEAVEELIMVVNDSVVERKNKRPFIATLKTACAAFERGSNGSALNRLENAFMNKVDAQVGKDNPDVAAEWKRIAQEIIEAYTREQSCGECSAGSE